MRRVRVSQRVQWHLSGSGAGQAVAGLGGGEGEHPDDLSLMSKLAAAPRLTDGAVSVQLTEGEVDGLVRYVECMELGAADNVGPWDPDALHELNSARALLKKLRG